MLNLLLNLSELKQYYFHTELQKKYGNHHVVKFHSLRKVGQLCDGTMDTNNALKSVAFTGYGHASPTINII